MAYTDEELELIAINSIRNYLNINATDQEIVNKYAENHERERTMDFHHQLKASILDAVDEGLINRDPTRKAIIKGKTPRAKKEKYLNQFELQKLISDLNLGSEINYDWLIYLIAKTGLRFSEALAVTPDDFDFPHQTLNIEKTWNYKESGGFERVLEWTEKHCVA